MKTIILLQIKFKLFFLLKNCFKIILQYYAYNEQSKSQLIELFILFMNIFK